MSRIRIEGEWRYRQLEVQYHLRIVLGRKAFQGSNEIELIIRPLNFF